MLSISYDQRQIIDGVITISVLAIVGYGFWFAIKLPKLMPNMTKAQSWNLRGRLRFLSFGLLVFLAAIYTGLDRITRPKIPAAAPQEAAAVPRVHRTSAARMGDDVKIVCGGGSLCAIAATEQDALKNAKNGGAYQVKSGTKAVVLLYDPEVNGADAAKVYLEAGPSANKDGWIPAKWMHMLPN
jgi:hypothetical protein